MHKNNEFPDKADLSCDLPQHIAIIMDGNGRWAKLRKWPRPLGHREGVKAVKRIVQCCAKKKIKALTLFAFSSENWRRPGAEVKLLMELLAFTMKHEVKDLHQNNVRVRFIGDRSALPDRLGLEFERAEQLTTANTGLNLNVAVNYGGQWDITQAVQQLARQVEAGIIKAADIDAAHIAQRLNLADLPEPDLFIRTGGEKRISNFLLWQLAYTELYFTDTLWPDFDEASLEAAMLSFSMRQRRFGMTGAQVEQIQGA